MKTEIEIIYNNLLLCDYHEINDKYGSTKIVIGNNLILTRIKNKPNCTIMISENIKSYFNNLPNTTNPPLTIFSIGNFYTHNKAKELCNINSLELVTCPVPLSNDSFCTNRLSKVNSPSIQCNYPNEVIIDMDLLSFLEISRNISGIGEFIGVYFSVLDYHLSRDLQPPKDLLEFLNYLIELLTRRFNQTERFLKQLAISLILKCYIMRIFPDYQIGCGIDHLLSNALEHYCGYNHGKAVFLSSIIANIILEKKYYSLINTSELVSKGIKCGIISRKDLFLIQKIGFNNIFMYAISSRPNRRTILTSLRDNKEEFNYIRKTITFFIQKLLNDNE